MEKKSTKIAYFVALGIFIVLLVVLVIALKSKRFDPLATLLPLCFMRLALMASELVRKKKKGVPAA